LAFGFRNKSGEFPYPPAVNDTISLAFPRKANKRVKSNDGLKRKKKRKAYEKPTATQSSTEEAKEKLRRLADQGNEQAKEMLRLIDKSSEDRGPNEHKKSA
jgi:hypothetical protein